MTDNQPSSNEVQEQVERICEYRRFKRSAKLRHLLRFVVAQWLLDGGGNLAEKFIGAGVGEALQFEPDPDTGGYPNVRANMRYVRLRLLSYYRENTGARAPVIIKLEAGSYVPAIAYNPAALMPPLDAVNERALLRIKTAMDSRTYAGIWRALNYMNDLDANAEHPLVAANIAFIPLAIAPIVPGAQTYFKKHFQTLIDGSRATGFDPWESTFAEGCIQASQLHAWNRALDLFELARENSQGEASYYWWYTALLASQGRFTEAIDLLSGALQRFARTSTAIRTELAMLQIMNSQCEAAEEVLTGALDFATMENPLIAGHLAILYEAQGRYDRAWASVKSWIDKLMALGASIDFEWKKMQDKDVLRVDWSSPNIGMIALLAGGQGNTTDATDLLKILMKHRAKANVTSSVEIALACIGAGQHDAAVDWLDRAAFEDNDPLAMWFHIYPPLRHLRGHAGFRALLRRLVLTMP